jgi:RHS repeat-associated protein
MNNTATNDLGLIYMNARYYVGTIGRFASADSLVPDPANPQQFNRYTYSLNNPIRYSDPTGHCVFGLPCPQPIRDGLNAFADFGVGALAQWTYDNSFHLNADLAPSPHEPTAMTAGRIVGGLDAMAQGIAEMVAGIGSMGGGTAACGTGALCVAGAPAIAAGEVIAAHGAGVTATSIAGLVENVVNMASKGSGGSGGQPRALQTGGHTFKNSTARALNEQLGLNYSRGEWGDALEAFKDANGIGHNTHGQIMNDGTYRVRVDGGWITTEDNIQAYLP